ncbi:MAG: hypothetical protein HY307_01500 [Arcobacter sp.]|nr:hypothetical protein [Arcobacter sp.]
MKIYKINPNDTEEFYKSIGCESAGAKILSSKSHINTLFIKDLHTGAANILKKLCKTTQFMKM